MASVVANVFYLSAELVLLLEIHEDASDVIDVQVGALERRRIDVSPVIESIVGSFAEDGIACHDLLVSNTHTDLILVVLFGKGDG